jgi:hypothetical protein
MAMAAYEKSPATPLVQFYIILQKWRKKFTISVRF